MNVEVKIAAEIARRAFWLGPVVAITVAGVRGFEAGMAALTGVGIVAAYFLSGGALLSWAGKRSPQALAAMAFGSFVGRLVVVTGLFWLAWSRLDQFGLGVGLTVGVIGLLGIQAAKELRT